MSNRVPVVNMTNFFNRELFMYALGDIRFKKPIMLKKVAYTVAFLILWALPIFFMFGLVLSPFYFLLMFAPPIALGHFASRPVWGGRGLFDYLRVMWGFMNEPKGWADLKGIDHSGEESLFVESEVWISRRRELSMLADEVEEERQRNKAGAGA